MKSSFKVAFWVGMQEHDITPPRNRGGVIFSLQFVSVCVCVCVCPTLLVNEIPAERMNRLGRGFR